MAGKPDSMIDEQVTDTDDRKPVDSDTTSNSNESKPADGVSDSADTASTPGPSVEEALKAAKAELAALSDRFMRQVADFHKTFHHPILSNPQIPSQSRCELRIELISEELKELTEAIQSKDLIEIADAL